MKCACLTIDDGPTPKMAAYVNHLNTIGIKAIWFCLGENLARFPQQAIHAIQN